MKNSKTSLTMGILTSGFFVLIGSFALFGQSLNENSQSLSHSSINEKKPDKLLANSSQKSLHHQCFEEICKKPVEGFVPKPLDYSGLIDDVLNSEIQKFTEEYSKNEIEIQKLVKEKVLEILSGELSGVVDFVLFDYYKIKDYQFELISSYEGSKNFEDYLREDFKKKSEELFHYKPDLKKWADQEFLFDEIIAMEKLNGRSDLERYSLELYPESLKFKDRLKKLSLEMVTANQEILWSLGLDLKAHAWSGEMFLETGLFHEEHFMDDYRDLHYLKMMVKASNAPKSLATVDMPSNMEEVVNSFQQFADNSSFGLIHEEAWVYDAFAGFDFMCRESIQDELYWASSDLRNRAVEKHFKKIKKVAKTMFQFDDSSKKSIFDEKVDRLELVKSRSIQEAKIFYPFYFKKLLASQKRSLSVLEGSSFRDTVLFLHAYLSALPGFYREGETPEEREAEDYYFVKKISLVNIACKAFGEARSRKGSFFSPHENYLYVELKSLRFFGDGIISLGHELAHGISNLMNTDQVNDFKKNVKSKVWARRNCINKYYFKDSKREVEEGLQTEEDWADFFAVKLVQEYKKTGDYAWAGEKFECEFVNPNDLNAGFHEPMKPTILYDGSEDVHSSNLFRIIAQEYYSQEKLGPACTALAKKESRLLESCTEEPKPKIRNSHRRRRWTN